MLTRSRNRLLAVGSITCLMAAATVMGGELQQGGPQGTPIAPSPEFTRPEIEPTVPDAITANPVARRNKLRRTDPLLRPPFAAAPVDTLKGMASGIRAQQLDVPNRVRAARFLGTVDCVTYPQAQEMLIQTLQEDPAEEVRFEAAMALRLMLSRCMDLNADSNCNCRRCCAQRELQEEIDAYAKLAAKEATPPPKKNKENLLKKPKKSGPKPQGNPDTLRYDCCRGCCNAKVLNALAVVAYEKDEQCCWFEPSERVRAAAASAMSICPCYPVSGPVPVVVPVPDGEVEPLRPGEVDPSTVPPPVPPADEARGPDLEAVPTVQAPLVPGLKGHCVVSLKNRQFLKGNPQFASVFEERTYHFVSAEAKAEFDAQPDAYAPAFGGMDPVEYVKQRQMVDGRYLREHEGRFYLFTTKENSELFMAQPSRFAASGSSATYQVTGK